MEPAFNKSAGDNLTSTLEAHVDTLILLENDEEHTKNVKEGNAQPPDGVTIDEIDSKLQVMKPSAAAAALGDATASLAVAYFNHIKRKVVNFADMVVAKEVKKPASQRQDFAEFQIIVEFHQTNYELAKAIIKAFEALPDDAQWKGIPDKYHCAFRVRRVWLLSCESGGDNAKNIKDVSSKYLQQAVQMRDAVQQGCSTDILYPPSDPPEKWYPYVYTFTTGDIVTGSTTLNPSHVSFKTTPYWYADPEGNIRPISGKDANGNPLADITKPSSGTIYQSDFNTGTVNTGTVPANGEVNILNNPMHDK